jgi:hypothetical protein
VAQVTLTWPEVLMATNVGIMRRIQALKVDRPARYGCGIIDSWTMDIESSCAEMAVAKLTKQYWAGAIGDLNADDVGSLQVRQTSGLSNSLIVHPSDKDDRKFILVTGTAPIFFIRGWMMGIDAKQQRFWKDPAGGRPAYFVPQSELRDINLLR